MKVLILGATGMLGHKVYQVLSQSDELEVYGTSRYECENFNIFDVYELDKLPLIMTMVKPDVVINCIGIITKDSDKRTMIDINSIFPLQLKAICESSNARLIHISTDCVFSGDKGNYSEGEPADAIDVYGKTKYLGEVTGDNVLTIRTSIIGRTLNPPHSLAELASRNHGLLEWFIANKGKTVNGYSNAIFSGFPTVTFAHILLEIILNYPTLNGLYHISSEPIDKYTLLQMINKRLDLGINILKTPAYVCDRSLNSDKFLKETSSGLATWQYLIEEMVNDLE